jgi:hypothetical protein
MPHPANPYLTKQPDVTIHAPSYVGAFDIIMGDLRHLCEYIEPTDPNLNVFSHRAYELFLRTCTEWESLCKDGYQRTPPEKMVIYDYKELESALCLEGVEVGVLFWRPAPTYIRPYQSWSSSDPPLAWYSDYNSVKHNRNVEFPRANFDNLRLAAAALFVLHAKLHLIPARPGQRERPTKTYTEIVFVGQIFSIRVPK